MQKAPIAASVFVTAEAAAVRLRVLNDCELLDVEELRVLADDLHACARERRAHEPAFHAYAQQRLEDCDGFHLADRRV